MEVGSCSSSVAQQCEAEVSAAVKKRCCVMHFTCGAQHNSPIMIRAAASTMHLAACSIRKLLLCMHLMIFGVVGGCAE
jgi:hypothetical protein